MLLKLNFKKILKYQKKIEKKSKKKQENFKNLLSVSLSAHL